MSVMFYDLFVWNDMLFGVTALPSSGTAPTSTLHYTNGSVVNHFLPCPSTNVPYHPNPLLPVLLLDAVWAGCWVVGHLGYSAWTGRGE